MNVALLTAFAVSLLICEGKGSISWADPGVTNPQPCQQENPGDKYHQFVNRHILNKDFDRDDVRQWKSYLVKKGLCGRVPVQSFIQATEAQVSQVCRASGQRVVNGGNLCISTSNMKVYDVQSKKTSKKCTVRKVTERKHKVVLACNKVSNKCLPVHYEKWRNQEPENKRCS